MKNKKRKLSLLLALVLGTTPILTNVNQTKSYAKETEITEKNKKELQKELSENLELYFSKIGEFDDKGEYKIKNYFLLQQKINQGDPLAKKILNNSRQRSFGSFITCVFKDQAAPILLAFNREKQDALIMALAQGAWNSAASILLAAAESVGGKFFGGVAGVLMFVDIGMSVYSCRHEW